ncbi:hypothetical protein ABB37_04729 [Leptomonas pyrrhocoris]|uniref:Uncharacterized protein n=1 Tax=Leptomonas pyrrhocoris TaxID=157538 RepID=A0A0M9G1W9_LEPPY|nr:hypothetical protein ABB37_04729 [Leptomonas pyrrhocoris]KPA80517.1 hypothetical protein ABB37_04729 [Leptomonas pyrrhocoris]|eukprot:XP_015658956.1 hypothetical protein ABB37_04729 [Leptomonas pyrrhocoris]
MVKWCGSPRGVLASSSSFFAPPRCVKKVHSTYFSLLHCASSLRTSFRAVHIEHSSDVHKWRSPEKEEVRRQFRGGVKLGSEFVKYREQEAIEKRLIEEDKFTNWPLVYAYSLGAALLLIGLNLVMVFVKPNPSPEYVPYVDPSATSSVTENATSSTSASSRVATH